MCIHYKCCALALCKRTVSVYRICTFSFVVVEEISFCTIDGLAGGLGGGISTSLPSLSVRSNTFDRRDITGDGCAVDVTDPRKNGSSDTSDTTFGGQHVLFVWIRVQVEDDDDKSIVNGWLRYRCGFIRRYMVWSSPHSSSM